MHRFIFALTVMAFAAAGVLVATVPAYAEQPAVAQLSHAAALSSAQIQSVIGLLQSFGVGSTTIAKVQMALAGTATLPQERGTDVLSGTSTCPTFSGDLSRGNSDARGHGDDVSALQSFLGNASSTKYAAGVTGYFGPQTEAGVKVWQSEHGVPATGFVGPMTRAAIAHACNPSQHDDHVPSAGHAPVSLSAQPSEGVAPLTVAFSTTGASSTQQYLIGYGDGSSSGAFSGGSNVSHTYSTPGEYTATLSPYVACMYSTPRCMIAVIMLAQTRVQVASTSVGAAIMRQF